MEKELTTLFTGRQRLDLEKVDSTNTRLAELIKKSNIPEGFLVSTEFQEAGRGQLHAKWKSDAGQNLLISLVFYPSFLHVEDLFLLNKTFALAVHDLVEEIINDTVKIKWPNDIYIRNQKVSGMLIENSLNTTAIQHSILGIGLNVNQVNFPTDLPNPVSLKMILGRTLDKQEVLSGLCSYIEARYLQLKRGEYETIDRDFEKALYRKDEWHSFISEREMFNGMIKGVDKRGRLLVRLQDSERQIEKFFDLKEIRFVD